MGAQLKLTLHPSDAASSSSGGTLLPLKDQSHVLLYSMLTFLAWHTLTALRKKGKHLGAHLGEC